MSRYCIGIDLGTSNCALAYVTSGDAAEETSVFPVSQYDSADAVVESSMLPSFLYFPPDEEEQVVGIMARRAAANESQRVVHSAKSWLCHGAIDRKAKILPWRSEHIADSDKLSSVEASARYLQYLKLQWDERMAQNDPDARFEKQPIVVTVPASFDAVAQKLTLEAAELAGFDPKQVRLLEEPQAAFYHWLQQHDDGAKLSELLPGLKDGPQTVLVCDIGGGTSDFSLFEIEANENPAEGPVIRRVAVSDHLLLGGDNIDLTLALALERKLMPNGERLPSGEWNQLVSQSRTLKEQVFSEAAPEEFAVSIARSGAGLFGAVKTASISKTEVAELVFGGFFPDCEKTAKPDRGQSGFKEFGLPYATDTGITRHLAEFIAKTPIDAVLFNGGSLASRQLQDRLSSMVGIWQEGAEPIRLENPDQGLAVAHGAARFGWYHHKNLDRIESGAGHAIYLELLGGKKTEAKHPLLCVLPHGSRIEEPVRIDSLDLRMRLNQPVRFVPYYSARRQDDAAGDIVELNADDFHRLPALETVIQLPPGSPKVANDLLDVVLEGRLNALGLLAVRCLRKDQSDFEGWQLDFNLRISGEEPAAAEVEATDESLGVPDERLKDAQAWATGFLARKPNTTIPRPKFVDSLPIPNASYIFPKKEWNLHLSRALWQPLEEGITRRSRSVDHEVAWLNLAGFALRPGYGVPLDEFRINALWRLNQLGLSFPKDNRVRTQSWVFWRRVAGGLDQLQQQALIKPWLGQLGQNTDHPAELIRLAGSLERLDVPQRSAFLQMFTKRIQKSADKHCEPYIWAIGRLLSRVPLYGGPESVLPAGKVIEAFDALEKLDWTQKNFNTLATSFCQAARLTGDRHHDLDPDSMARMIAKLKDSDVRPESLHPLEEVVQMEESDRARLFGEALPPGLMLK